MGWFIAIAVAMWLMQCLLGLWQFKKFNLRFKELRGEGRVVVGRAKGKLRSGVVVLVCIDQECNVLKCEKMQGMTIFAGLKAFDVLNGQNLLAIKEEVYQSLDKNLQQAILNAVANYKEFERQQLDDRAVRIAGAIPERV